MGRKVEKMGEQAIKATLTFWSKCGHQRPLAPPPLELPPPKDDREPELELEPLLRDLRAVVQSSEWVWLHFRHV